MQANLSFCSPLKNFLGNKYNTALRTKQEVHRRWPQICAQQNWSDGTQVVGNRAVAITRAKASPQEILIHEFQPCNSDPVCAKELGSQAAHPE